MPLSLVAIYGLGTREIARYQADEGTPPEAPAERRAAVERVPSERKVHTTMVSEAADQAIGMPLVVPGPKALRTASGKGVFDL